MFRAKFWHSTKLDRTQAYVNVAKASTLWVHVLANPDLTHFTSILQHHSLKWSFVPGAGVDAWVRVCRAMCACLIKCDDHMFSSSGPTLLSSSSLYGNAPLPWNAPRWTCCYHMRHHAWTKLAPSEEQDGQSGQIPETKSSHLEEEGKSSLKFRDCSRKPLCQVNKVCTVCFKGLFLR